MSDDDDESSSGEEGFVVRVRTLMGSELYVFAYLSDTVELLKTRIAFQEGVSPEDQRLLQGSRILPDDAKLSSLGVGPDSTLTLVTVMASGRSVVLPDIDQHHHYQIQQQIQQQQQQQQQQSSNKHPLLESRQVLVIVTTSSSIATGRKSSRNRQRTSGRGRLLPSLDLDDDDDGDEIGEGARRVSSSILGLNRLKAEMFLYSKREATRNNTGLPYSMSQLGEYVRLKVRVLQEGRSWAKRRLTPTVVVNRKEEKRKAAQGKENSGRSTATTARKTARVITARPVSGKIRVGGRDKPVVGGRVRCGECRKRLGLVGRFECRCGGIFCPTHRYAETHDCTYDYKTEGRRTLAVNNPRVLSNKLPDF